MNAERCGLWGLRGGRLPLKTGQDNQATGQGAYCSSINTGTRVVVVTTNVGFAMWLLKSFHF